jgi:hypothetical protein
MGARYCHSRLGVRVAHREEAVVDGAILRDEVVFQLRVFELALELLDPLRIAGVRLPQVFETDVLELLLDTFDGLAGLREIVVTPHDRRRTTLSLRVGRVRAATNGPRHQDGAQRPPTGPRTHRTSSPQSAFGP